MMTSDNMMSIDMNSNMMSWNMMSMGGMMSSNMMSMDSAMSSSMMSMNSAIDPAIIASIMSSISQNTMRINANSQAITDTRNDQSNTDSQVVSNMNQITANMMSINANSFAIANTSIDPAALASIN